MPVFPFQHNAVDAVFRNWAQGPPSVLVSFPTDAEKTLVAAAFAQAVLRQ